MFTIKHIHENGEEVLWSGEMPRYIPPEADATAQVRLPGENGVRRVSFWNEGGNCQYLYGGKVFVMNEDGKTVAAYELGEAPCIKGENPAAQAD